MCNLVAYFSEDDQPPRPAPRPNAFFGVENLKWTRASAPSHTGQFSAVSSQTVGARGIGHSMSGATRHRWSQFLPTRRSR